MDDARNQSDGQAGDNRISLDGSSFDNVGSVNINVHGAQHVDSRVQEYEVDYEDHGASVWIAELIDALMGDKAPLVRLGLIVLASGSAGLAAFGGQSIRPYLTPIIWVLIISVLLTMVISAGLFYQRHTTCDACGSRYSFHEHGTPTCKDTETRDGTQRITTRFYRCDECGHEDHFKQSELISYDEEDGD